MSRINPNKQYKKHLDNYFYLRFINTHIDTSVQEKMQAQNEMLIAERKMKFWERQGTFSLQQKELDTLELKKQWANKEK